MSLTERIARGPDRRVDQLTPIVEQRAGEERRAEARWRTWTRENQAAKALSGRVAA